MCYFGFSILSLAVVSALYSFFVINYIYFNCIVNNVYIGKCLDAQKTYYIGSYQVLETDM